MLQQLICSMLSGKCRRCHPTPILGGSLTRRERVPTRMLDRLVLRASFLVPLAVCGLSGPACAQTPSAKNPANTEKKAAEPKLTKQQQRGLRLLQSAQAEAAALQPDMRAYVLMQVADGYQKVDPSKADALLKEAFTASLSIEDMAPSGDGREQGNQALATTRHPHGHEFFARRGDTVIACSA